MKNKLILLLLDSKKLINGIIQSFKITYLKIINYPEFNRYSVTNSNIKIII